MDKKHPAMPDLKDASRAGGAEGQAGAGPGQA